MIYLIGNFNRSLSFSSYLIFCFVVSLGVFFAAKLQFPGESPDWVNYNEFFDLIRDEGLGVLVTNRFEPGFGVVSYLLAQLIESNLTVYGIMAGCAIFLKCWTLNKLHISWSIFLLTLFFYFIRFAPLHELTQLRVACASAFLLLATVLVWRDYRMSGWVAYAMAFTFHFTSVVFFPFIFFASFGQKSKALSLKVTLAIGLVSFVVASFTIKLLINYFQNYFSVVAMYQETGFGEDAPNLFSMALLIDWGMILISMLLWGRLTILMKYVLLIQLVGVSFFYATIDLPVVAFRLREFFSVFWVLFVAEGLKKESGMRLFLIFFIIGNSIIYSYHFFFGESYFF